MCCATWTVGWSEANRPEAEATDALAADLAHQQAEVRAWHLRAQAFPARWNRSAAKGARSRSGARSKAKSAIRAPE